ncbi:MAG: OadG family protein [Lachnospiraceae bacterium]|nr:OadG family protein [Lachnospiraceae bacterium]
MTILAIDMGRAGLNTVLGIGIVFMALILISLLISCLKLVNKMGTKQEPAPVPVKKEEPAVIEEEDVTDDLEIVAVITAAITAYEEANGTYIPADGLVVRQIKRINKQKWQNA